MLERFTPAARNAVRLARTEARALQHPQIGTEHLLLALLVDDTSLVARLLADRDVTAASVRAELVRRIGIGPEPVPSTEADDVEALKAIGIDLEAVRRTIEENFGQQLMLLPPEPPRRRGLLGRRTSRGTFTGPARKVLELALREAIRLKHTSIGTEHLMLGVLRANGGLGARILADAGVDLDALRGELVRSLPDRAA